MPTTVQQLLAERIKTARAAAGISPQELADLAELSAKTIYRAEGGVNLIQESSVLAIAKALGTTPAKLLELPDAGTNGNGSAHGKPASTAPERAPWCCPRCHGVNAPWVDRCGCPPPS